MTSVEKAFSIFLIQLKRKNDIHVIYYSCKNRFNEIIYEYSYVGYETAPEGMHGIHYNAQKDHYYFGTVNQRNGLSGLIVLPYTETDKIPTKMKDAFKNVIKRKAGKHIKIKLTIRDLNEGI